MKRIITFDYLRTLQRDTLIQLVLASAKHLSEKEAQVKRLNMKVWEYRGRVNDLEKLNEILS
ncbi:MAG TPA: hypothetical protein VGK59_23870 [Ohtaekwangia sp.]